MRFFRFMSLVVGLMYVLPVQAQEEKHLDTKTREEKHLDTKTQDVYGPTTTLFTTQDNIKYNLGGYKAVAEDMGIGRMHRFTFVQQYGNKLQNLGNNGTAVKPIFYTLPEQIGTTAGFHAYDIYCRSPRQLRYYDTKSPYSKMHVILARFGSFFADICHSRNITPQWNLGVNFRHMMTDKEWIPQGGSGDRNVIAYGLDIFTHYKTDDERYQLLAHFLKMKHRVRETGGIWTQKYIKNKYVNKHQKHAAEKELLKDPSIENRLRAADNPGNSDPKKLESSDARKCFFLYHQLALDEELWVYHELGIQDKYHLFQADQLLYSYNRHFLESGNESFKKAIKATTTVWNAQNELGVKGDWQDWFYCSYYRHSNTELAHKESVDVRRLHEHYVGLRTRYHLAARKDFIHLGGEYLFPGFYKACVGYQNNIFDLACERVRHTPSFLTQCYEGYLRKWDNQFKPPTATQIRGGFRLEGEKAQLRPHAGFTWVERHIYFKHRDLDKEENNTNKWRQMRYLIAKPQQAEKHAMVLTWGTALALDLGFHMHWDSELTISKVLGPSAKLFRVPTFLVNSSVYYARTTAKGNGTMETGVDMHWKSSYMADGYDPVTQQFFLQDAFNVYSYPVMDLFLNFRIKSFCGFLKFSHWNEHLLPPGYFVTPFYPGQKMALDIGVNWSFFD